mgnify:CR=1 FL=1
MSRLYGAEDRYEKKPELVHDEVRSVFVPF